jgi:eukaryotic-like serine/threonine-protein kinase
MIGGAMTPEQWQQARDILNEALEHPPHRRAAFLTKSCSDNDALRSEVEALLAAYENAGSFLEDTPLKTILRRGNPRISSGTRLGPYEVKAMIGAGGMGEVYRAHDSRLRRDVAVKILPSEFTGDHHRLARFEREARVLATLNHSNIGAIYGIEDAPTDEGVSVRALVLELVEGETLAERIKRSTEGKGRAMRLDEVLIIARQIAEALEVAHEKGIVHRDLKPANIKITPEGVVKILDFGLAKAASGEAPESIRSEASTATLLGSHDGHVIGTAAYMSPEQARGTAADKRSDIWAFGCVLFEMLTGRTVFGRETVTDTLSAIVESDPDWTQLPASVPFSVRNLIRRCLEKDPKRRLRDIGDARYEIEQVIAAPVEDRLSPQNEARRKLSPLVIAVLVVSSLAVAGGAWLSLSASRAAADRRISRFTIDLPEGQTIGPGFNSHLAFSPDGTRLAFTPLNGPVYIRRLDSLQSEPLEVAKTRGIYGGPMFSPDGTSLAFIEGNEIISSSRPFLKASLAGGAAVKLADYDAFHEGEWGPDGKLYWTASYQGGIVRIGESGGEIEPVTKVDTEHGERSHRFAHFLPDGKSMIYTVALDGTAGYDDARIDLWDLTTGKHKPLISGGTSAMYSPSGHIVYARAGKLFAVPFDPARQEITGSAFEVLDGVMMSRNTGVAEFRISARGDLAYILGPAEGGDRTLVSVDRSGKAEPLPLSPASYLYPRLSPDGQSLAFEIEGPNHDFYLYDFARAVLSKMTSDGLSHNPVWAPDGKRLAFRSWKTGGMTMWSMPVDRSSNAVRLEPHGTRQSPVSFSPDGKYLTFDQKDPQTDDDAWVLPVGNASEARPIAKSPRPEGSAKFSPDGKWIAYSSMEFGRPQIFVQPFPGLGPKLQISNDGGVDPVWRRSGGELYYRNGNKMMVVSVTTTPEFRASAPRQLWEGDYSRGSGASCGMPGASSSNYDVTPDGQHFLMVRDDARLSAKQIVVVLNWAEELRNKSRVAASQR